MDALIKYYCQGKNCGTTLEMTIERYYLRGNFCQTCCGVADRKARKAAPSTSSDEDFTLTDAEIEDNFKHYFAQYGPTN